ncbi:MAG: hypothetical protein OXF44_14015 [Anaerolineaceae bacterium]|nr:hypothetical protein [Anaerolineaceae bacterium]
MALNEEAAQVLRIATARIDYRPEDNDHVLDVTVKSASGVGRLMAPQWSMVLDFKEGRIDWPTYVGRYQELMRKNYARYAQVFHDLVRNVIAERKCLVLTCYCNTGPDCRECHRFLMADILEKIALSEGYEVSQEGELERRATPVISPLPFGNDAVPF